MTALEPGLGFGTEVEIGSGDGVGVEVAIGVDVGFARPCAIREIEGEFEKDNSANVVGGGGGGSRGRSWRHGFAMDSGFTQDL